MKIFNSSSKTRETQLSLCLCRVLQRTVCGEGAQQMLLETPESMCSETKEGELEGAKSWGVSEVESKFKQKNLYM